MSLSQVWVNCTKYIKKWYKKCIIYLILFHILFFCILNRQICICLPSNIIIAMLFYIRIVQMPSMEFSFADISCLGEQERDYVELTLQQLEVMHLQLEGVLLYFLLSLKFVITQLVLLFTCIFYDALWIVSIACSWTFEGFYHIFSIMLFSTNLTKASSNLLSSSSSLVTVKPLGLLVKIVTLNSVSIV